MRNAYIPSLLMHIKVKTRNYQVSCSHVSMIYMAYDEQRERGMLAFRVC